jgi:hypothetical protein
LTWRPPRHNPDFAHSLRSGVSCHCPD